MTGTEEGAALGSQSVVLHGLRSIMIAPLLLDDRLLGVVYLDSTVAKGIFTSHDAGILIALANHIAVALETARAAQLEISIQAAQRQRDLADRLRSAFEAMSDTLEPTTVLDRLLHWTSALVPNDGAWLVTRDESGHTLRYLDPAGHPLERAVAADPTADLLLAIDQPVVDPPVPDDPGLQLPTGTTKWAALPLRSRTVNLGVLLLASAVPERHLDQEIEVAAVLVAQGMTAYDNASLFARVHELATHDELTGLANRRRYFELATREFATAGRHERPIVVMMVDVDHFKRINDTHGHPSGDDVIREVARRLATQMRGSDVVGRYGGEEFAVVAADADAAAGYLLAERLRTAVSAHLVATRTGPVPVTVSIGFSQALNADESVETVLARADEALYRAKQAGRDRSCGDTDVLVAHPA
jgi:diguanylate cyclase (GGDEF)-like protein